MELDLTREDCEIIYDFLDAYFFQMIRDDVDMDNIDYVRRMIHCHDVMWKAFKQEKLK